MQCIPASSKKLTNKVDETGYSNLVVFEKLFDTYRKEILHSRLLMVEGRLQGEGQVVHVIVSKCFDFTIMLGKLVQREADDLPILTLSRADENLHPIRHKTSGPRSGKRYLKMSFTGAGISNNLKKNAILTIS